MPPPRLGRSVLALVALVRAGGAAPSLMWEEDIGPAGTLCSNATGRCHSFAHFVFLATRATRRTCSRAARFPLTAGSRGATAARPSSRATWSGTCEARARGGCNCEPRALADVQLGLGGVRRAEGAAPPASLCARPWLVDLAEGGRAARGCARCVSLGAPVALARPHERLGAHAIQRVVERGDGYCSPAADAAARTCTRATAATATRTEPPSGRRAEPTGRVVGSKERSRSTSSTSIGTRRQAVVGLVQFDYDALDAAPSAQARVLSRLGLGHGDDFTGGSPSARRARELT